VTTGSALFYYCFNYFRPDSERRPDLISKTAGMQYLNYNLEQIHPAKLKKIREKAKFRLMNSVGNSADLYLNVVFMCKLQEWLRTLFL
jgi:hypothetical protein